MAFFEAHLTKNGARDLAADGTGRVLFFQKMAPSEKKFGNENCRGNYKTSALGNEIVEGENWRKIRGKIHSVETCGTVDGPGIRFVAFFSGCSLRCKYCHNPDTSFSPRGEEKTAGELVAEIARYENFMKSSGGGVTLSGGDPLFQMDFAEAVLHGCKKIGLHTALDTSGNFGDRVPEKMLKNVDLVLLDVKSGVPEIYKNATNGELAPTLRFAEKLQKLGKKAWLRFVLVPGLTDSEENIHAVAEIAKRFSIFEKIEILPFHRLGFFKWQELGLKNPLENVSEPSMEAILRAKEIFGIS